MTGFADFLMWSEKKIQLALKTTIAWNQITQEFRKLGNGFPFLKLHNKSHQVFY